MYNKDIPTLHNLGSTYISIKMYYESEDVYKQLIKLNENDDLAYGNLGWVYYCVGKYDKSIIYSNKAIQLDEDAYYAMFNIALATLRMGKFDESKELYKKYVKLCLERNQKISKGTKQDLMNLIDENILVEESNYIIKNILGSEVSDE